MLIDNLLRPNFRYLEDFKEALIWLAETDNSEPYMSALCGRLPDTLIISYQVEKERGRKREKDK